MCWNVSSRPAPMPGMPFRVARVSVLADFATRKATNETNSFDMRTFEVKLVAGRSDRSDVRRIDGPCPTQEMKIMKTVHAIGAVALREMREILADRWTLVAVTIMPLIVGVLLTALYANRIVADLPLGVIDEDRSATSRMLVRALDAHQTLTAIPVDAPWRGCRRRSCAAVPMPDSS